MIMSGLNDEERGADEAGLVLPVSSTGDVVDLLDSTNNTATTATDEAKLEFEEADDVDSGEEEFHDTADGLSSGEEDENISTGNPPNHSIAAVSALVNEVRHNNTNNNISESPLISKKLEAMEQGSSHYQDDPNSDNSPYYSPSFPPDEGVWSSQRPQLQSVSRYSFIGSFIRSKLCTYCVIVTTLIGIGVGISAAVTQGFKHAHHRNDLLHPKWEMDGQQQPKEEGVNTAQDNAEKEGSIMQTGVLSLPTEVYTDDLQDMYYTISETYIPIWFGRESGWNGSTHAEAMEFCKSRDDTSLVFVPCPYDVYCPDQKLLFNEEMDEADSWAPLLETDKWVQVGSGGRACESIEMDDLGEELTRHIMCCLEKPLDLSGGFVNGGSGVQVPPNVEDEGGDNNVEDPIPPPPPLSSSSSSVSNNNDNGGSVEFNPTEQSIFDTYHPYWFSDVQGWSGTTYEDAKMFCESMQVGASPDDTFHLCPLEAYCPNGPINNKPLYFEMSAYEGEQWAPISDEDQQWVMIGNEGLQTCVVNPPQVPVGTFPPTVKKHLMCCHGQSAPSNVAGDDTTEIPEGALEHFNFEGSVINELNPVWYGTDEWISGSYEDATHFCNFKGKELCPYAAFCPYGPGNPPIGGWVASIDFEEQWAPIKGNDQSSNQWVLIGVQNDDPFGQCIVEDSPSFGFDKSQHELKLHIMCCDKEQSETSISESSSSEAKPVEETIDSAPSDNDPVWYSSNDGWDGGSHETALIFCLGKKKTLCPVETYCPNGPKRPPLPGHGELGVGEDFEQWAPASDKENYWIMVGLYAMDETTRCQDQDDILGGYPSWGLDGSYSEHKRHVLCCSST